MKNHAFIIPVHKQPELLGRIIKILDKENHHFFIHVSGQVKNFDTFVKACHMGGVKTTYTLFVEYPFIMQL